MILYFAYGSNMSTRRLRARVSSATVLGIARLDDHRLAFHKFSRRDRSAKCDIVPAPRASAPVCALACVWGVVYEISPRDKRRLDRFEGLGFGYEQKQVDVVTHDGQALSAITYYATHIKPGLQPYTWYRDHVIHGAREAGLPDDYINQIEQVPAVRDPNPRREARELAIYARDA